MRVLLDTNVVLDLLLGREPWRADAEAICALAEAGRIEALVSASAATDLFYIIRRCADAATARRALADLRGAVRFAPLDHQIIDQAIDAPEPDFEDAVHYRVALHAQADCLVTRDRAGFPSGGVPVLDPVAFLAAWRGV